MNARSLVSLTVAYLFILGMGAAAHAQAAMTCCQVTDFPNSKCPNVQPLNPATYVPTTNGCGPQGDGGVNQVLSAAGNVAATFGPTDFTQSCDVHDTCYGTCGNERNACDVALASSLAQACLATYKAQAAAALQGQQLLDEAIIGMAGCTATELILDTAVLAGGTASYNQGQQAGCQCCDNCYCTNAGSCPTGQTQDPTTCACSCATQCPAGQTQDPVTCGCSACTPCPAGAIQDPTTCACTCPSGQVVCGVACITLGTDQNCSGCGDVCPGGEQCSAGMCTCARTCRGGQILNQTNCTCSCPPSFSCPPGVATDPANCACVTDQCGAYCPQQYPGSSCAVCPGITGAGVPINVTQCYTAVSGICYDCCRTDPSQGMYGGFVEWVCSGPTPSCL